MLTVPECKMIMRMLEQQILDIQARCSHESYRGDPVEAGRIKCTCATCQHVWYLPNG